jgi:hypothetical protein
MAMRWVGTAGRLLTCSIIILWAQVDKVNQIFESNCKCRAVTSKWAMTVLFSGVWGETRTKLVCFGRSKMTRQQLTVD